MYARPQHQLSESEAEAALRSFDRIAILTVHGPDGLAAVHVPILVDGGRVLLHVARANPIWRAAPCPALLVCPGPDAYVSPGWYETKKRTGRAVPTWNYEAVHVAGALTAFDDPERLRALVAAQSDAHEQGRPEPWAVDDAPPDYIDAMLRGFVGLELTIDKLSGKRKVSQDKPAEDRAGVMAALAGSADGRDRAIAAAMQALDEPRDAR